MKEKIFEKGYYAMGFKEAVKLLTESLKNMEFTHYTERNQIWDKNKLYTGDVNVRFVLNKLEGINEKENYFPRSSWDADDGKSHIFINNDWYIKYILLKGIVNIISVHKDE